MITVFLARLYGRFKKIQSNLRRKKLQRTIKSPVFLEAVLAIETMQEPQSDLEEKVNPSVLKDDFFSRTDQPILTSIAPVLFRLVKRNQLSFSSIEINRPLPDPVHSVL